MNALQSLVAGRLFLKYPRLAKISHLINPFAKISVKQSSSYSQ
jgi:hypothetical protein